MTTSLPLFDHCNPSVRESVVRHGGSIKAASELDRGSTFMVRLSLLGDGVQ